ncbi:MAG: hypothetical protein ABSH24_28970 [Bryobacteraceae bacterium]|jgi:hypothetical protein
MSECSILFNKSIEDLRRIGAMGGRAHARNCRARRQADQQINPILLPVLPVPLETTAQAIAKLDARYPWLKGAERRTVAFPADWVTYEPAERLD